MGCPVTPAAVPADHMLVPWSDLAIMAVILAFILAYWVFSRYSYEVTDDTLKIRRWIFGLVPLGWYRVRLGDIVRVEPSGLGRMHVGVLAWASPFTPRGLLLTLLKPRHLFWDTIYIAPPDRDAFMALLQSKLGSDAVILSQPAWTERRPWPLWITDAVVAVAWLCFCAWMPILAYTDLLSAQIGSLTTVILIGSLTAIILPVHLWFWLESLRSAAEHSSRRRWLWFVVVSTVVVAGAVAYYLLEWRPRHVAQDSQKRKTAQRSE